MENKEFINSRVSLLGFESLNPMQKEAIKSFSQDRDLILLSETGSGKSLAFLLPLCAQLKTASGGSGIIIVPARELALQIKSVFDSLKSGLRGVCCYGGNDISKETKQLQAGYDLIIATPGRLLDHLDKKTIDPSRFEIMVLDEFDKSLELGFTEEMEKIVNLLDKVSKKILTSATQAIDIPDFVKLHNPLELNFIEQDKYKVDLLTIYKVESPIADKLETLYELLCTIGSGQKIVFCNYRESVERVSDFLRKKSIEVVAFHGGLEQEIGRAHV